MSKDEANLKLRPQASAGVWTIGLLPVSLILSSFRHPLASSQVYKLASVFSFGLLLASILLIHKTLRNAVHHVSILYLASMSFITTLFYVYFDQGLPLCFYGSLLSHEGFYIVYNFLLRSCPYNFSLGEAAIVAQGLLLFIYTATYNVLQFPQIYPHENMKIATLIIQFGLLGIGLTSLSTYIFRTLRSPLLFYTTCVIIFTFVIIIPLHLILKMSPVMWIFTRIYYESELLKLVIYWVFCCALAVAATNWRIKLAQKASTTVRKIFHLLAVVVYIPGLTNECSFLYLATGVVLGIFIFLETLRILNMPPLGYHLQNGFTIFSDDKDTGPVALTPIYLLVGCSLPIWLHPASCDVTDSAGFNLLPLLSGILSIGIGDTVASIVGSRIGKFRWRGSSKTVEGTVSCILSQLAVVYSLFHFGILHTKIDAKIYMAVIVTSLVEARTSQIDNLVLPLVMFIILS